MNIRRVIIIFVASVITTSCSEKSGVGRNQNSPADEAKPSQTVATVNEERTNESELQPPEDEIAEDCVAFLRSTKTVPANGANADCPQCPVSTKATEVLKFDDIRVDRVARSGSTCEVNVTIRATFNPSTREKIAGALTAWISPEQKTQYLQGKTPPGQQVYKVKVIYRRVQKGWRAVEFDRP